MNEINPAVRWAETAVTGESRSDAVRELWRVGLNGMDRSMRPDDAWVGAFLESGWRVRWAGLEEIETLANLSSPDVLAVVVDDPVEDPAGAILRLVGRFDLLRPVTVAICAEPDPGLSMALLRHGIDLVLSSAVEARVLEAQVRVIVDRLLPRPTGEPIESGRLRLDPFIKRVVCVNGDRRMDTALTPTECRILEVLLRWPYRAHARAELIQSVWGSQTQIDVRTIDVHMRRLREGLSRIGCEAMLETVRGVGYRLVPD